jgi:hypothetical protein
MITAAERRSVIADYRKKQKGWTTAWYKRRGDIVADYTAAVKAGRMEEEFIDELCDKYDCGRKAIRNAIARSANALNPKAQSITQAQLVTTFQTMDLDLQKTKTELESQLEELDAQEHAGEEWVGVKQTIGGKLGAQEDRIPIGEQKYRTLERIIKLHQAYWDAVGKILPKRLDIRTQDLSGMSDEELRILDAEIEDVENGLGVNRNSKGERK